MKNTIRSSLLALSLCAPACGVGPVVVVAGGGSSTTIDAGPIDAAPDTTGAEAGEAGPEAGPLDAPDEAPDASVDAATAGPCLLAGVPSGTACECSVSGADALGCGAEVPTCCAGDAPCQPALQPVPVTCAESPSGVGWCCSGKGW